MALFLIVFGGTLSVGLIVGVWQWKVTKWDEGLACFLGFIMGSRFI